MRRRPRRPPDGSRAPRQLPFIDVVFLLLIFFALTARILLPEGDLQANLPRFQGPGDVFKPPLPAVRILLEWVGREDATPRCVAKTIDYQPAGGEPRPRHEFATLTPGEAGYAPNSRVDYPYPDFHEVREYLRARRDAAAAFGDQVPVILHFSNEVPAQMIINVLDICVQLGLEEFSLAAEGVD